MIGDLFFVHERGYFMTLIQFILSAASNFSAIIVGPISSSLGWRYLFHILNAFAALEVILLILFVPETVCIPQNHVHENATWDRIPSIR